MLFRDGTVAKYTFAPDNFLALLSLAIFHKLGRQYPQVRITDFEVYMGQNPRSSAPLAVANVSDAKWAGSAVAYYEGTAGEFVGEFTDLIRTPNDYWNGSLPGTPYTIDQGWWEALAKYMGSCIAKSYLEHYGPPGS